MGWEVEEYTEALICPHGLCIPNILLDNDLRHSAHVEVVQGCPVYLHQRAPMMTVCMTIVQYQSQEVDIDPCVTFITCEDLCNYSVNQESQQPHLYLDFLLWLGAQPLEHFMNVPAVPFFCCWVLFHGTDVMTFLIIHWLKDILVFLHFDDYTQASLQSFLSRHRLLSLWNECSRINPWVV